MYIPPDFCLSKVICIVRIIIDGRDAVFKLCIAANEYFFIQGYHFFVFSDQVSITFDFCILHCDFGFLLQVKCPVIARHVGVPVGSMVIEFAGRS